LPGDAEPVGVPDVAGALTEGLLDALLEGPVLPGA
jgi:hypothetical protein